MALLQKFTRPCFQLCLVEPTSQRLEVNVQMMPLEVDNDLVENDRGYYQLPGRKNSLTANIQSIECIVQKLPFEQFQPGLGSSPGGII